MTAADALGMIAGQGAEQVAVTALRVLAWPALALAVAVPLLAARRYFRYRRDRAARWAELRPEPHPAPRPECPWCDTRECIDRDLCNCAGPCGSWLCVVKEADHG